jgi:hypothetical protein
VSGPWYWPDESGGPTIRGDFVELFDQDFQEQRGGKKKDAEVDDGFVMPQQTEEG